MYLYWKRKKKFFTTCLLAWNYFIDEINELKSNGYIDPDNFHWDVEFFISADWKFLQLVRGIKAPTSEYFCLYCDCPKSQRANMNIQWNNTYNTKKQSKYLKSFIILFLIEL
jgi:hypothetical protein